MGRRSLHWLCAQYAFGGKLCGLAEAESGFHGYGGAAISKRGVDRRSSAGAGDRARRHAKFLRRTGRTADGGQAVYGGGRRRQAQGGGVELRAVAGTLWRLGWLLRTLLCGVSPAAPLVCSLPSDRSVEPASEMPAKSPRERE